MGQAFASQAVKPSEVAERLLRNITHSNGETDSKDGALALRAVLFTPLREELIRAAKESDERWANVCAVSKWLF